MDDVSNIIAKNQHPIDRIRELVAAGHIDEARAEFEKRLKAGLPYFYWCGERSDKLADESKRELFTTTYDRSVPTSGLKLSILPAGTARSQIGERRPWITADFHGLVSALRLNKRDVASLIRDVIIRHEHYPMPMPWACHVAQGLERAVRSYLLPTDGDAKIGERWIMLQSVREGRVFGMRSSLPHPRLQKYPNGKYEDPELICRELEPVLRFMRHIGLSDRVIKAELLQVIRSDPEWASSLACASVSVFSSKDQALREVLEEHVFPKLFASDLLIGSERLKLFPFGEQWMATQFVAYAERLVVELANGRAGVVLAWLLRNREHPILTNTTPRKRLRALAFSAFERALAAGHFGYAAALAQQYQGTVSLTRATEAAQAALERRQPIALEWERQLESEFRQARQG